MLLFHGEPWEGLADRVRADPHVVGDVVATDVSIRCSWQYMFGLKPDFLRSRRCRRCGAAFAAITPNGMTMFDRRARAVIRLTVCKSCTR